MRTLRHYCSYTYIWDTNWKSEISEQTERWKKSWPEHNVRAIHRMMQFLLRIAFLAWWRPQQVKTWIGDIFQLYLQLTSSWCIYISKARESSFFNHNKFDNNLDRKLNTDTRTHDCSHVKLCALHISPVMCVELFINTIINLQYKLCSSHSFRASHHKTWLVNSVLICW